MNSPRAQIVWNVELLHKLGLVELACQAYDPGPNVYGLKPCPQHGEEFCTEGCNLCANVLVLSDGGTYAECKFGHELRVERILDAIPPMGVFSG